MGLFGKNKKNKVVWRNREGQIVCTGDNCPQKCDEKCPIWENTMGLTMLKINEFGKAVEAFQHALEIAPDFVDAQNNMGTAYGMSNQHQKAYEAFSKALAMRPRYAKALRGMIVAEKNLGKYDEALRHCDELESYGDDASDLREGISNAMGANDEEKTEALHYLDVTLKLLDMGREKGYIQSKDFAHIPEIMACAERVCLKIVNGILDCVQDDEHSDPATIILLWSAFAGMGAVFHWHVDWDHLSKAGIYEVLTKERGIYAMDEYVYDTIGIGFGSEEEKEITRFLRTLANCCIDEMVEHDTSLASVVSCAQAMYLYGMMFEMNRLGMR